MGDAVDISEEEVQKFVNKKIAAGLSQKTVRDVLVVLKMILRFAVKHGLMAHHQIDIVFPTEREKADVEVLTINNQRQLMTYVKENFTFLNLGIFICLNAGLRIGEVCALQWDDIDVTSGVIRVSKTIQRIYLVDGEQKYTELIIDKPKTKNSIREIPMTRDLMAMVKPFKRIVRGDYYVLTNAAAPTEPRTYRTYFNKLQKQLGLPKMRFHGLRHSFATRCIESKCDYKTVSVLLGHSNISTTLNLYVHPNMEQKRKCIDTMNKLLK
jgi:integrase